MLACRQALLCGETKLPKFRRCFLMKTLTCALILALSLPACSRRSASTITAPTVSPNASALVAIDPHVIFEAYEGNALAADLKYKDKPVLLRGRIRRLDKDGDRYYAGMGIYSSEDGGGPFPSVCCYIADSDLKKFAALDPGKLPLADVEGIVVGKESRLRSVKGWSVILDQCHLVNVK